VTGNTCSAECEYAQAKLEDGMFLVFGQLSDVLCCANDEIVTKKNADNNDDV